MSSPNNIRFLLDIQDINIIFEDECVKEGQYKGKHCKYIAGKLSYDATHCKECGKKMKTTQLLKTELKRRVLPYPSQAYNLHIYI